MTRKILLTLLSFHLLSCGDSREFSLDPSFNAEEVALIRSGADDWNAKVLPDHRLIISLDGPWQIHKQEDAIAGRCNSTSREIWIMPEDKVELWYGAGIPHWNPVVRRITFHATIKHEFGHSLGLQHTKSGVMEQLTSTDQFTQDDLDECRRVGSCP